MKGKYQYAFKFQYRENNGSELKTERFFIVSNDKDGENACEIAMLQFIKKHGYFSGKLVSWFVM